MTTDRLELAVDGPAGPAVDTGPAIVTSVATGVVAFSFYVFLGDPTDPFDVATGVVSAVVVALVLGRVTFERSLSTRSVRTFGRAALFLPYLLAAVVRANVSLAGVVLDPRLPIDPAVVRIPAPSGRLATALLANSITLTPGTLTLAVDGDELVVHTLTEATREELVAGGLARAVAFVVDENASRWGPSARDPTASAGTDSRPEGTR